MTTAPQPAVLNLVALFKEGETWVFLYDDASRDEAKAAVWESSLPSADALRLRDRIGEQAEDEP